MRLGNLNKNSFTLRRFLPFVFVCLFVFTPLISHGQITPGANSNDPASPANNPFVGPAPSAEDLVDGLIIEPVVDRANKGVQDVIETVLHKITEFVWYIGGSVMAISGVLFNKAIEFTVLDMSSHIENLSSLTTVWSAFRDLANIGLVFILLYIGISTIIKDTGFSTKKLLGQTIIVALFINFSYLLTTVVIDLANVLTIVISESMQVVKSADGTQGIANAFTDAVKVHAIGGPNPPLGLRALVFSIVMFFVYLIVSVVLFFIAILLIARLIILIILLMVSPIAFMASIIEGTKNSVTKVWWNTLVNQSFFAPSIFLFFWITVLMIQDLSSTLETGVTWQSITIFDKFHESVGLLLNMLIILGILIAGIFMSRKIAGGASSGVNKIIGGVSKYVGGAVVGGGARAGRTFIGGGASVISNTDFVKRRAPKIVQKSLKGVAGSSFDVRNTKTVGFLAEKTLGIKKDALGKPGKNRNYTQIKKEKDDKYAKDERDILDARGNEEYRSIRGNKKMITDKDTGERRPMTYAEAYASKVGKRSKVIQAAGNTAAGKILAPAFKVALQPLFENIPGFRTTAIRGKVHETMITDPTKEGEKVSKKNEERTEEIHKKNKKAIETEKKLDGASSREEEIKNEIKKATNSITKVKLEKELETIKSVKKRLEDEVREIDSSIKVLEQQEPVANRKKTFADQLNNIYNKSKKEKEEKEKKEKERDDKINELESKVAEKKSDDIDNKKNG